jgi:hypothetical protein
LYLLNIIPGRVAYARFALPFAGAEADPQIKPGHRIAKPRRPGVSLRLKRSGGSLAAPAFGASPESGVPGSADRAMRYRERRAARRASRRRGESEAKTAPSAAAMMLGRQIPIADETVQRCHAPEPTRPVAHCIGDNVRPADEGRGRR